MELGTLLFVLLVVACPLMMLFMHRGHGGHASHDSHAQVHPAAEEGSSTPSLDELRSRRSQLEVEIARLEQPGSETKSPASV
jgi:hypothetical protein